MNHKTGKIAIFIYVYIARWKSIARYVTSASLLAGRKAVKSHRLYTRKSEIVVSAQV